MSRVVDDVTEQEETSAAPEPGGPDKCVCPECGYEADKKRGIPCRAMVCPKCDTKLVASTGEEEEERQEEAEMGMSGASVMTMEIGGARVPIADLIDAWRQLNEDLAEAVTKKMSGRTHTAGDFLVVEDSQKPSTWHLPVKVNGKPNHRLMGGAWAALHGGYRGQKYSGPGKSKALSKLRALYKSEGMELPTSEAALPDDDTIQSVLAYLLAEWQGQPPMAQEGEIGELTESASGAAIGLVESEPTSTGARAPLLMDVALIRPGWGNKTDNRYYSREMLARDAKVFEGAKMYTTDHRQGEKSVRTEVSQVQEIIGFTDDGAPIARVAVHDPDFAEAARNRAKLKTLESLECSILARGKIRSGEVDGRKGFIVEAITDKHSVDWVTRAGAGGHALNLAETDGGGTMSDEQERAAEQESGSNEQVTEAHPEEEVLLSEAEATSILGESNLPDVVKKRLAESGYKDAEQVEEAITAEVEYLKAVTGSGKPFGQGGSQPPDTSISEADVQKKYDDIDRRHGLYVAEKEE